MLTSATPPTASAHRSEPGALMQTTQPGPAKIAYSIREACQASSLGRTTLCGQIAAGRLRAIRIGGRTVIPADSLHALVGGVK